MKDTSLKTLFLININETERKQIIIAVKRERNRTDEKQRDIDKRFSRQS